MTLFRQKSRTYTFSFEIMEIVLENNKNSGNSGGNQNEKLVFDRCGY